MHIYIVHVHVNERDSTWTMSNLSSVGSKTSLNSSPTCNERPRRRLIFSRMHCRERIPGRGGGGRRRGGEGGGEKGRGQRGGGERAEELGYNLSITRNYPNVKFHTFKIDTCNMHSNINFPVLELHKKFYYKHVYNIYI